MDFSGGTRTHSYSYSNCHLSLLYKREHSRILYVGSKQVLPHILYPGKEGKKQRRSLVSTCLLDNPTLVEHSTYMIAVADAQTARGIHRTVSRALIFD